MLKIRRPLGRLIFKMGIAIPGKTVFLIETVPSKLSLDHIRQKYVIFTNDLIEQGARASAAMVLTWYDRNNPNSHDAWQNIWNHTSRFFQWVSFNGNIWIWTLMSMNKDMHNNQASLVQIHTCMAEPSGRFRFLAQRVSNADLRWCLLQARISLSINQSNL